IISQGGDIIDIGAYSSRPNAEEITEKEELRRLREGLETIRSTFPDITISVDTFRSTIAKEVVEKFNVNIINDISGGLDPAMFSIVAKLGIPYILMHMRGTPGTMQNMTYYENITADIIKYFSKKINALHQAGINDIILDPGFGFAKNLEDNYRLMRELRDLKPFGLPILAGISRKSMIYQLLHSTPEDSLNGTTALNMMALTKGADILRVHDVKECVETIKIFMQTNS
ncbi:MAG: dihydropteroate synthase, partial [Bacteroidales bacterium]